jgi:hypothetical protein
VGVPVTSYQIYQEKGKELKKMKGTWNMVGYCCQVFITGANT